MAQNHAAPAQPRVLAVVRAGTAVPESGPATVPPVLTAGTALGTAAVPVPAEVVPLTVPERTRLAVAHWGGTAASGAGKMWLHPDRMVHALWHGRPESMAEHYAYVRAREWVPPELGRKWRVAVTVAGIVFHVLIGAPLGIVSRITGAASKRPLRFLLLTAFLLLAFFLLSHYL